MAEITGYVPQEFADQRRFYPWDRWLDGQAHVLDVGPGKDVENLKRWRQAAYQFARTRGFTIITRRRGDAQVTIQRLDGVPR